MSSPEPPVYSQNYGPYSGQAVTVLQIPHDPESHHHPRLYDPPPTYNSTMRLALPIVANPRCNLPMVHGRNNNCSTNQHQPVHILMARYNRSICQPSAPFYYHAPPPPTYSESEFGYVGRRNRHPSLLSFECAPTNFTRDPQLASCRNCGYISLTITEDHITKNAHVACVTLCLLGCLLCCWLPYVVKSCKETRHYCAYCNKLVGIYNPWDMRWTISEQDTLRRDRDRGIRLL